MTVSNDFSYIYSSDNLFIDGLYKDYKKNPESVDYSWRQFFRGFEYAAGTAPKTAELTSSHFAKEFKVYSLIQGYRARGHLMSTTDLS